MLLLLKTLSQKRVNLHQQACEHPPANQINRKCALEIMAGRGQQPQRLSVINAFSARVCFPTGSWRRIIYHTGETKENESVARALLSVEGNIQV